MRWWCTGILYLLLWEGLCAQPTCTKWTLGGAFVYWLPAIEDSRFVASNVYEEIGSINPIDNPFSFSPAFRLEGSYRLCDRYSAMHLSYMHGRASTYRLEEGLNLTNLVGAKVFLNSMGTLLSSSSSLHLFYEAIQAYIEVHMLDTSQWVLSIQGGAESAYLSMRERYICTPLDPSVSEPGEIRKRERMWGAGPYLGININYRVKEIERMLPGDVFLTMYAAGATLMSNTRQRHYAYVDAGGVDITYDIERALWTLIPAWHIRCGGQYTLCHKLHPTIDIGYEFHAYLGGLTMIDPLYTTSIANQTVSMHGVYASLSLAF